MKGFRAKGAEAERQAVAYLRGLGWKVLETNTRAWGAELDVIAQDGPTVVFLEVKARYSQRFGPPELALNERKKQRMRQAALRYLAQKAPEAAGRFDVILIGPQGLRHIRDAFEL